MKNKFISAFVVGIVAVIVVLISDLVSKFTLSSFAWIAFILWNFTAKTSDDSSKLSQLFRMIIGIPVGVLLAICMIHGPTLFSNNIIAKYVIVFLCNGVAMLFPGCIISAIFFGIGLTFSGLGAGLMPNNLESTIKILVLTISFSLLGMIAAWSVEKLQSPNNK